jgi:hypothetical protein
VRVFVSYNRADQSAVEDMARELRRAGHDIWLDALLRGGHEWWTRILDEIERSDVVVLALSPAFLRSEACAAERRYAGQVRRPVLPVEIVPVNKAALPGELAGVQICGSVAELVVELRARGAPPPLPVRMPPRPPPPLSRLALLRDRLKEGPLDEAAQFAIVGELILAHRSPNVAGRETARLLLEDSTTSNFLFQRPGQLIQDELRGHAEPLLPPPPGPPTSVIIGAALAGVALFSLLSMLRVYAVLPRPYEVVGPHAVLVVAAAVMCIGALRRHRRSALLGLTVCALGALALVADLVKNSDLL